MITVKLETYVFYQPRHGKPVIAPLTLDASEDFLHKSGPDGVCTTLRAMLAYVRQRAAPEKQVMYTADSQIVIETVQAGKPRRHVHPLLSLPALADVVSVDVRGGAM